MEYFKEGELHYLIANPDEVQHSSVSQAFNIRFFDQDFCLTCADAQRITEGRGTAIMFTAAGKRLFLKDYRRGGMIRHLSDKSYFWTGLSRTRAWCEFKLLVSMAKLGLNVPEVIACRVEKRWMTYRARLIVAVIQNSGSLLQTIKNHGYDAIDWYALGEFIGSFGAHRIFHADLNASNILVGSDTEFFLIDFDRGQQFNGLRAPLFRIVYEKRMLQRLYRSLLKSVTNVEVQAEAGEASFPADLWNQFLNGYRQTVIRSA